MSKRFFIAGIVAVGLGVTGTAQAQTNTGAAPSTSPPEQLTGSSTMNNPATATTPQPGSPAAMSSPGTASPAAPALGTPADTNPATTNATHSDATPPGAPVAGANSFTEGQARSRMQDSGFGQVSDLRLDSQGIWRGKATKDGKNVTVALDYQGNVVTQ